jgi:PAS domain-containing protein
LFGASRVSVWLHERLSRRLVLEAASDATEPGLHWVSAEDRSHPAALGLRAESPLVLTPAAGAVPAGLRTIAVGLRGQRRAIGTLVFEGVHALPGMDGDVLHGVAEIGRHLSLTVENGELLDQVISSRREIDSFFDSLTDPIVICDRGLRVMHANEAFATRLDVPRHTLLHRLLSDLLSPAGVEWLTTVAGAPASGPMTKEIEDSKLGGRFAFTVVPLGTESDRGGMVVAARDVGQSEPPEKGRSSSDR